MHNYTRMLLVISLVGIFNPSANAKMSCVEQPSQMSSDTKVAVAASVGRVGPIKAGELKTEITRTTKEILSKIPNSDRVYLETMMFSSYCSLIRDAESISEKEKEKFLVEYLKELRKSLPPQLRNSQPSKSQPAGTQKTEKKQFTMSAKSFDSPPALTENQKTHSSKIQTSAPNRVGSTDEQNVSLTTAVPPSNAARQNSEEKNAVTAKQIEAALFNMTNNHVGQLIITTVPQVAGGIECEELSIMLSYAVFSDVPGIVNAVAAKVRHPISSECIRNIGSKMVSSESSSAAMKALISGKSE